MGAVGRIVEAIAIATMVCHPVTLQRQLGHVDLRWTICRRPC